MKRLAQLGSADGRGPAESAADREAAPTTTSTPHGLAVRCLTLAVPPHALAAAPGRTADVLFTFTPGMGRFDSLRLLGRAAGGEADPAEIAASSERYDNRCVDSPVRRAELAAS